MRIVWLSPLWLILLAGCNELYYRGAYEEGRDHPRERMVAQIEALHGVQEDLQAQIVDTLDCFYRLTQGDGIEPEPRYDALNRAFDESQRRKEAFSRYIEAIPRSVDTMLEAWQAELQAQRERPRLEQYRMREVKRRWRSLHESMLETEAYLDAVMAEYKAQLIALSYSLNADTLLELEDHFTVLEQRVDSLLSALQRLYDQSEAFSEPLTDV